MPRILLPDWGFKRSRSRMTLIKLRIWKEESIKKCSKHRRKSRLWKMRWLINLPKRNSFKINLRMRSWEWVLLRNSFRSTRMVLPSKSLITPWSMIQRKIRFCKVKSTTAWMTSRKNWSKTSLKSTPSSSILRAKELKATINTSSKTACNSAMRSIWILLRDVWAWPEYSDINAIFDILCIH